MASLQLRGGQQPRALRRPRAQGRQALHRRDRDAPASGVIDLTTDVITTFAGTGTAGFSGDDGPALQAQFFHPRDLEFGPDGRLYVADTDNSRVRAIDLDDRAWSRTVVGTGEARARRRRTTCSRPRRSSSGRSASSSIRKATSTSATPSTAASSGWRNEADCYSGLVRRLLAACCRPVQKPCDRTKVGQHLHGRGQGSNGYSGDEGPTRSRPSCRCRRTPSPRPTAPSTSSTGTTTASAR